MEQKCASANCWSANCRSKVANNGTTLENTIDWQYNNAGQIENVRDDFSVIDYDYGDFGRMYQALNYSDECLSGTCTVENTPSVPQVDIDYTYDNFGDRKTLTGSYLGAAGGTTYTRDDAHRLTGISRTVVQGPLNYNYTVGMTYDPADRPTGTTRTYVNNVGPEAATQPTTTLTYEPGTGRLDVLNHNNGTTEFLDFDHADRITWSQNSFGTHTYSYDFTDQLTSVDNSSLADESFTIDANGNMSAVTSQNKLTTDAAGNTYVYDNEGNVTGIDTPAATNDYYQFVYDQRNRLTRVNRRTGTVSGAIELQTNFTYDALDRRVIKSVAGVAEKYAYDGDNLYLKFNASNTLTHRYLHGEAVDSILADEDLTVSGGVVDWQLTDHQGSVILVRRASDDSTHNYLRYSAFGELWEGVPASDQQFSYTGREFDAEVGPTGAYFMRARYYDPKLGRFLSQDPSGFSSGDINLYRYAENDPVRNTDRFGLQATSVWNANLGSASLSTLDFGSSRDAFFAREQARLANELQGSGRAMAGAMLSQEFIAQPEMNPGWLADMSRQQDALDQTPVARVQVSPGNSWIYQKMVRNQDTMTLADKQLYFRQMRQEHGDYMAGLAAADASQRALERFIPGASVGHDLRDAIRVDYDYETLDLYASGRFAMNGAAEPSTGDLAESFATITPIGFQLKALPATRGSLYDIGLAKDLRRTSIPHTQVHHVPQTAEAESLIGQFNLRTKVGNEPAIRLSISEHEAVNAAQRLRSAPASARDLMANDIRILRNSTDAPNSALKQLIDVNQKLHQSDYLPLHRTLP